MSRRCSAIKGRRRPSVHGMRLHHRSASLRVIIILRRLTRNLLRRRKSRQLLLRRHVGIRRRLGNAQFWRPFVTKEVHDAAGWRSRRRPRHVRKKLRRISGDRRLRPDSRRQSRRRLLLRRRRQTRSAGVRRQREMIRHGCRRRRAGRERHRRHAGSKRIVGAGNGLL